MQPYFNEHKQLYISQQCVDTEHQTLLLPIICFYEVQGEGENFNNTWDAGKQLVCTRPASRHPKTPTSTLSAENHMQ